MTVQRVLLLTAWIAHTAAALGCKEGDTPVCNSSNDAIVCNALLFLQIFRKILIRHRSASEILLIQTVRVM
jgi:hypothetical protein